MDIINERTVGMSFEEYKVMRKTSNDELKKHKKGKMIFVAAVKGIKKGMPFKKIKNGKSIR